MSHCNHQALVLLNPPGEKLRCRHCHLTVDKTELAGEYCPECYEEDGVRRTDFESVQSEPDQGTRYRCEECGIIIRVS